MTRVLALLIACAAVPASAETPGVAVTSTSQPPVMVANSPPALPVELPPPQVIAPAPLPLAPHIVSPPAERRPAQAYVMPDDYPDVARVTRQQGRVEVRLEVGPHGRVQGCAVTASSGSSALDSATCGLLVRRARFTPARDSNGNPVTGTVEQQVEWRLPAGQ